MAQDPKPSSSSLPRCPCCSPALQGSPARSQQPKRAADLDVKLLLLLNSKQIHPKSGVEGRLPAKQSLPAWPSLAPDESFAMQPRGQICSAPSSPPAALPEPCSLFNEPYQKSSSKISSSRGSAPNELDGKRAGLEGGSSLLPQSLRSPRCDSGHPTHTRVPECGARSPLYDLSCGRSAPRRNPAAHTAPPRPNAKGQSVTEPPTAAKELFPVPRQVWGHGHERDPAHEAKLRQKCLFLNRSDGRAEDGALSSWGYGALCWVQKASKRDFCSKKKPPQRGAAFPKLSPGSLRPLFAPAASPKSTPCPISTGCSHLLASALNTAALISTSRRFSSSD